MKTLFRVKTTTYVVVMVFILTHICLLYSSIAECVSTRRSSGGFCAQQDRPVRRHTRREHPSTC